MEDRIVVVNLTKNEFFDPRKLGLRGDDSDEIGKLSNGLAGIALLTLLMTMPQEGIVEHIYNPETKIGVVGRWAGDRIAFVGPIATDFDLDPEDYASTIIERCVPEDINVSDMIKIFDKYASDVVFHDITSMVAFAMADILGIRYSPKARRFLS